MDGTGGERADNVVRLPREWVGSLDDLVPMGSRARASDTTERGEADEADDRSSAQATIPAAQDFWGGGAAAVQGAIQPAGDPPYRSPQPEVPAPDTASRARTTRSRPRPRRPWGFSARVADVGTPSRRVWSRAWKVAIVAALVCVVSAAALGLAEGGTRSSRPGGAHASAAVTGSGATRQLGPAAGGLPASRPGGARLGTQADQRVKEARARKRAAAHERAARMKARHRRLERLSAARRHRQAESRAHDSVATSSGSGAEPTQSTPASTATTPPPTTPTTTPTATSASGSGGSAPTQTTPTHHSAYGASGVLGAGHSSGAS